MPSESILLRLLEQVEGSHFTFIRFVGRVNRHEWDWAPDEGIPSARELVTELLREESRLASKIGCSAAPATDGRDLATPAAAAATLRTVRELTLAVLRRQAASKDEAAEGTVTQSAVSLAQLDAHAVGGLALLQRLIDPSRAGVSPR